MSPGGPVDTPTSRALWLLWIAGSALDNNQQTREVEGHRPGYRGRDSGIPPSDR